MGLKLDLNNRISTVSDRRLLKSDQNGIEIGLEVVGEPAAQALKSDQNGIEIGADLRGGVGSEGLKSDQNGIEID